MKASISFQNTIQAYLEQRADYDELFARSYRNPLKNIEDCVTYILNEVKKSGCNGFDDMEIFGMATHFYDEANIEIGKPIECKLVINHMVELSTEEKEQVRMEAMQRAQNEAYSRMKQRKPITKKESNNNQQMTLIF